MPLFVVDAMGDLPGLPGLFVSGIFSASLSTVSAAVNSLAAVTLEDYIKVCSSIYDIGDLRYWLWIAMQPLYKYVKKHPLPETESTLPSKIMALSFGLICIGVAFIGMCGHNLFTESINEMWFYYTAQHLGGILQASLTVFGVVGGPLFGLFTLGMFSTRANQRVLNSLSINECRKY